MAKVETFKEAKARLLTELEKLGWTVKRDLTYPWAKRGYGGHVEQVWFKTQSIYLGGGLSPTMKMASSICSDYRGVTGAQVEQAVDYFSKR